MKSKYQIVKESWGSRTNFQASYGLKMTPEDLEEGERILEAFQQMDADSEKQEEGRQGSDGKGKRNESGTGQQQKRS
ncbi:hypothetical protein BDZ91DRAFT_707980 [Kalaharituber pfeilii]|nr:hypothetical protein BDZ91DRAFT_707980 [Kalaharituber pfeilii]